MLVCQFYVICLINTQDQNRLPQGVRLVELLVVLAIIGSPASIGLVVDASSVETIKTDLANVRT